MQTLEEICKRALQCNQDQVVLFDGVWVVREEFCALAEHYWRVTECFETLTVAFVANNRPASLALFLAMLAKGHRIRMVYPFQSLHALNIELTEIDADVVVIDHELFSDGVETLAASIGALLFAFTGMTAQVFDYHVQSKHQIHAKELVLLTSGTTGKPKPFAMPYETVLKYYTGEALQANHLDATLQDLPPVLLYFPVSNITGLFTTLPPLVMGQKIMLLDRFKLEDWLQYIETYRPAVSGLPPAAYKMILDAKVPKSSLASLKFMGSGSAPLDPIIKQAFEECYDLTILLSYGATEFGGPLTRVTPQMYQLASATQRLSQGKPLEGMKVRIVDPESGIELPSGREGRIEVVSFRIGPDWISTNDLGYVDDDGYIYLKGRIDGAITRGGFKIIPSIVEAALLQHPAIADSAVVAVADNRLGEVPGAAVVCKDGVNVIDVDELKSFLRKTLLAPHIPVHWCFVKELPRTPSYKVSIPAVKALFV